MRMRFVGDSKKPVYPIGLGCLQLTLTPASENDPQRTKALKIVEEAYRLGINLFDTADFYGTYFGENEEFLGNAFKLLSINNPDYREHCFITSKGGVEGFFQDGIHINNSREYLINACNQSLRRLGISYIDLYYLHRHDGKTSPESIMDTMAELVTSGKIRAIGLSEVDPLFIARAHNYAKNKYGFGIAAVQPEYSIASREIEYAGVLELCAKLGINIIPYGSISRGLLTNGIKSDHAAKGFEAMLPRFDKAALEQEVNQRQVLTAIAHDLGCTESQLSLGWLLHKDTSIIPIPATTNPEHLRDNALAATLVIPKTKITEIDNEFPLGTYPPRYPAGFSEIETDAQWIKRYQEIKQEANKSKVEMATIRGVTFQVLQAYTTNKMNAEFLKQLVNSTIDPKTVAALSSKSLSECHDGITSGSLAVYDARSASPSVATSGNIDKSADSKPVDPNTKFNIASISKFILMVMTIRLCMQGRLDLDKTLAEYLPDLLEIPEASTITLRHLLSHHSGLQNGTFKKYMKSQPLTDLLLEERVGRPGEKFQYANVNYVLIGKIIEKVTNDSLENQFRFLISVPLKLDNTYHIEDNMKENNLAEGFKYTSTARLFKADSNNYIWAADGFRSTPADLTKLSHSFFNDAVFISPNYRDQVIDSIRDVTFLVVTRQNTYRWTAEYGMGLERHHLQVTDAPEKKLAVYGNGGWLNGFATFVLYSPEQKVSVCFTCTKTQGAQKLNLSKLTEGYFFKSKKPLETVVDSEQKTHDLSRLKPD